MRLFQGDNHSTNHTEMEVSSSVDQGFIESVRSNYPHIELNDSIRLIGTTNVNSTNYVAGKYFIKLIPHNGNKKYVENFPMITNKLNTNNIPAAQFIKNKCNDFITNYHSQKDDKHYYIYLQERVYGSFFNGSYQHLLESFSLLTKLRTNKIELGENNIYCSPYKDWNPDAVLKVIKVEIDKKNGFTPFDQLSGKLLIEIEESLDKFSSTIGYLMTVTSMLHHCDLHPHNLLFIDDEFKALIDLESFVFISLELSEAFALYKLGRKCISTGNLTSDEFNEEAIKAHFSLDKLFPFIQIELIRRLIIVMELHYLRNVTIWDNDLYKHSNGLSESKIMFSK